MTARDRGVGDAVFLERFADGERTGIALDRSARRQDIRDVHDIGLDHVRYDHAVGVRIRDVVEANLLAIVLEGNNWSLSAH